MSEIKKVIITGASYGIGKSLAIELSKRSYQCLLIARSEDRIKEICELINKHYITNALFFKCDVSKLDEMKNAVEFAKQKMQTIDIAILNAGISKTDNFLNYDSSVIRKIFDINLFGITNGFEALLPEMLTLNRGKIVAVGSLAEARGFPFSSGYSASKIAVSHICEAARIELRKTNVKIVTVKPGFVKSNMTAKNSFYMPFLMEANEAAKIIADGIEAEKPIISFPETTAFFSWLGKFTPSRLYEWAMSFRKKAILED